MAQKNSSPQFQWNFLLPKYWLLWLSYLILIVLSWLPLRILMLIGRLFGIYFSKSNSYTFRKRRYIIARNLELAFPQLSIQEREKIAYNNIINSGSAIIYQAIAWLWSDKRFAKHVKLPQINPEYYSKYHYIILSPHFLEMELSARAILTVLPTTVGVYRPHSNPLWEYLQYRGRMKAAANKDQLINRNNLRGMLRIIGKKQGLWYAPDHDYGRQSAQFVPFFAVADTSTTTGSHMFYRKYPELKILPIITLVHKNSFELRLLDLIDLPDNLDDRQLAILINQHLERIILLQLDHYMWMHRRFKTSSNESNRYPEMPTK